MLRPPLTAQVLFTAKRADSTMDAFLEIANCEAVFSLLLETDANGNDSNR